MFEEFPQPDTPPELSFELNQHEFYAAVIDIANRHSTELSLGVLRNLLDEADSPDDDENEVSFKRGNVHFMLGQIEYAAGEYEASLRSYRNSRRYFKNFNITAEGMAASGEAALLAHELKRPVEAIEPYEFMIKIHEEAVKESPTPVPKDIFEQQLSRLSHLAASYQQAGDTENLRRISQRCLQFASLTPAVYGFEACENDDNLIGVEQKPLYKEIQAKLTGERPKPRELDEWHEGLRSLERLVNNEGFMPDMPEQKEFVLMSIYMRYAETLPNPNERQVYVERALRIAKKNDFFISTSQIYIAEINNSIKPRNTKKAAKAARHCLANAEKCIDEGVSIEASGIVYASIILTGHILSLGAASEHHLTKLNDRLAQRGLTLTPRLDNVVPIEPVTD